MPRLSLSLAICSVLACAQETPTAAGAAKKAAIEGVVVNEVTKEPLRRAEISLYGQGKPGGMGSAYSAVTDAAGRFRIENIDPGDYQLVHRKPGFMTSRAYFGQSARVLKLAAGDSLTGLRYALLPQAIITGRVLDEYNEPVQGAYVLLLRYRYDRGTYRTLPTGWPQQTNDLGEFRFVDVSPGRYYLHADARRGRTIGAGAPGRSITAPGEARVDFVPTYHLNATDAAHAIRIDVQAGQELPGRDIVLRKEKVVRVSGRVLDADGTPAMCPVFLGPADDSLGSVGGVGLITDGKGTFAVNSLPPGQYVASAIKGDQSNWQSAPVPVTVGDDGVQNLVLQIQPTMEAKGALVLEGSDRKDFDFSSFSVAMRAGRGTAAIVQDAKPTREGAFTLSQIARGRYMLNVSTRSDEGYTKSILVGSEDVYGKEVDGAAVAAAGVRIVVRLDSGALTGTVEIPEERKPALRSPGVVLLSSDARFRESGQRHVAQLNPDDAYELKNLQPGEYIAFAFEDFDYDSLLDPEVFAAVAGKGTKVSLAANESKSIDLKILPWPEQFADRIQ